MLAFLILGTLGVLGVLAVLATSVGSAAWWVLLGVLGVLLLLAIYDVAQRRHSLLRNYPVVGHLRFLLEAIRPELQQYFIERNYDGRPFDRDTRTIVYERAKGIAGEKAFGTELDVNAVGYEYLVHSASPADEPPQPHRVRVGGPDCRAPYDMALLNVSAMSFGALSGNAVRAMNGGAALGGFAQDTGEGGLSRHHLAHGGDLIWELGSGYFGARLHRRRVRRGAVRRQGRPRRGRGASRSSSPRAPSRGSAGCCPAPRSPRRSPRPAAWRWARR